MEKAEDFINELQQYAGERAAEDVLKFFKGNDGETIALGVKFGTVFNLAKNYTYLPLDEIEKLLDSPYYEIRMGAASIMDYRAKCKKTSESIKKELFELYINRHDRLNNWDFPDRAAPSVIGDYLLDKPADILYQLARSKNVWERRTAIVATHAFIKKGQTKDTFQIAEILLNDDNEFIQKAVGSWLREAGKKDEKHLKAFLDRHVHHMPRVSLRYAVEKLDSDTRKHYMNIGK